MCQARRQPGLVDDSPRISQVTPSHSPQNVTEVGLPSSCQALPQLTEDPPLLLGDPVGHHSVQRVKPDTAQMTSQMDFCRCFLMDKVSPREAKHKEMSKLTLHPLQHLGMTLCEARETRISGCQQDTPKGLPDP